MPGTKPLTFLDTIPPVWHVQLARAARHTVEVPLSLGPQSPVPQPTGGEGGEVIRFRDEVDPSGGPTPRQLFRSEAELEKHAKSLRKRKDQVTGWYLDLIETNVDAYLEGRPVKLTDKDLALADPTVSNASFKDNNGGPAAGGASRPSNQKAGAGGNLGVDLGFTADAIPYNYLDEPPKDLGAIHRNLDVLSYLSGEVFHPGSHIRKTLVDPLVQLVWAQGLTPLLAGLEALESEASLCYPSGEQDNGSTSSSSAGRRTATPSWLSGLRGDLEYLRTIHKMEAEWARESLDEHEAHQAQQRSLGLSDVVPISGLVLSKIHRLENEHRTVLEHWGRRMGK